MVIGPNILILPLLNPMHVAEEAATLDVLTGGNYVLGAGLGYREPEFTAFGIPLSERAGRFSRERHADAQALGGRARSRMRASSSPSGMRGSA